MRYTEGGFIIGDKLFSGISRFFKKTDVLYWVLTLIASVYGCVLIASLQRGGDVNFLRTQIFAVIIGYIAAVIISGIDYKFISKCWWLIAGALANTVLFFTVSIPMADKRQSQKQGYAEYKACTRSLLPIPKRCKRPV